jgi:uncharacterized protein YjbI with pentapeptide repeats
VAWWARPSRRAATVGERRPPRPISWWWTVAAATVVAAAAWVTIWWLLTQANRITGNDVELAKARIDAVRTGLATAGGAGAAVALLLAFRRQHHEERTAAATAYDAGERRITELYTKAVEQFGSDKAAVRLGGLYALERLAQGNVEHRQTIVDVICAYLRMPYTPPGPAAGAEDRDAAGGDEHARRREELQVRLTAQRILTTHLVGPPSTDKGQLPPSFWADIDIDLTGATLVDVNLDDCHVRHALLRGARFHGTADFDGATFDGNVRFRGATFHDDAGFGGATFHGTADFSGATFHENAGFRGATFHDYAGFGGATFDGTAGFRGATFRGNAGFGGATFHGTAGFRGATFRGNAGFGGATFRDDAFDGTGATVVDASADHRWPAGWMVRPDGPGGGSLVRASSPAGHGPCE